MENFEEQLRKDLHQFLLSTKEAFNGYVACLHQLYLMGTAMHLKRNNSSNLAYGLLIDLSKRSLFYNKSVKFSPIFLPVSAKSCIFAASIGIKTCR